MELDKERLEIVRGEVSFGRNLVIYYFCNSRCPPIVPQLLFVEAKLKVVSGCLYGGKNLVITIQMSMTTNTNQIMPNKRVINHFTGDIFKPAICSSPSKKEQEQSLLALPRTLN